MLKKTNLLFMSIIFLILFIPFVASAPPVTTTQQINIGYIISDSPQTYLKQNTKFQYNFFLYNLSNGVLLDNSTINCAFYLSNSSGNVIYSGLVDYYATDGHWDLKIGAGNFSKADNYYYGTKCVSSSYGGQITGEWIVTPNGTELTTPRASIDIGLLCVLIIFLIGAIVLFISFDNLINRTLMLGFSYILIVVITFVAWNMASDFLISVPMLVQVFKILFIVLEVGTIPVLLGLLLWYLYMVSKIKEIRRLMDKGFTGAEAERRQHGK